MNPFDLDGPSFLFLFAALAVAALIAAFLLKRKLQGPSDPPLEEPRLSPDELGYLSGGPALAVHSTVATLVDSGRMSFDHANQTLRRTTDESGNTPLEQAILRSGETISVKEAYAAAVPDLDTIRRKLERLGMLLTSSQGQAARWWPILFVFLVIAFGAIKILVGLGRDKPVSFLIVGCIVLGVLAVVLLGKRQVLTRRGLAFLAALRERHSALKTASTKAPSTLVGNDLALAVSLFGVGILAGGAYAGLQQAMLPAARSGWIDSGTGSSCSGGWSSCGGGSTCSSGASCGGGGDGGGGSGCGGSGCGGCGGGGD